jgi:hypothetical protein
MSRWDWGENEMDAGAIITSLRAVDVQTWLAIGSAVAAFLSFLFNWLTVRKQMALQSEALKGQIDAEVLAWGDQGLHALTRAALLAESRGLGLSTQDFVRERAGALSALSALVDKGRLYFPNTETGGGIEKSRAFRGGRPLILNPLVFAFHELETLSHVASTPDADAARFFIMCRREFVSELQHHLNPRRRGEAMRRLGLTNRREHAASYEDSLRLAEDLEKRHPGLLRAKGDAGWDRNVTRAKQGDRASPRLDRPASTSRPPEETR